MRLFTLVALFMCVGLGPVFSQSFYAARRERNVIGSVGVGTATYLGDLRDAGLDLDTKPSLSIGLQYFLNNRFAVRSEFNYLRISASDANAATTDRQQRNLSFFANNFELNATGIVNFLPNRGVRYYRRSAFNIYAFAGVGLLYMNPKTTYQGKNYALQPLMTEGVKYSRFQPVIPYGFGIKIKQSPVLNICIEAGFRKTFTDYIDDVSSARYPADPSTLSSDMSRTLSDRRAEYFEALGKTFVPRPDVGRRGNPKSLDSYYTLTLKLEYYLPYDIGVSRGLKGGKTYNPRRKYDFNKRRYKR